MTNDILKVRHVTALHKAAREAYAKMRADVPGEFTEADAMLYLAAFKAGVRWRDDNPEVK